MRGLSSLEAGIGPSQSRVRLVDGELDLETAGCVNNSMLLINGAHGGAVHGLATVADPSRRGQPALRG